MPSFELSDKNRRFFWYCLLFMLAARIIASSFVPLTDTTEARYAEIARKMLELGDWITPWHEYGVPFWAKPPLSFWLSALSMKWFGISEFAARLPSLLFGIGMLVLVWMWVVPRRGRDFALIVCTVLASSVLFFVAAGAVMTDSSLAFCTTLAMIAFWQTMHDASQRRWGYAFFVALGIGLLAKGPLVGVLTLLAIVPWIALRGSWRAAWQRLPWLSGGALMLLIAAPWYALAEYRTPGFLRYFILGEHLGRFLDPGWSGDRYGHAHSEAFGTIWVFWLASAAPWSLLLLARAWQHRRRWGALPRDDSGFSSYLLLWSFAAMGFFTFARNIIWPYALPALPAFAVLVGELWIRARTMGGGAAQPLAAFRWPFLAAFCAPVALLFMTALYADDQQMLLKSSQRNTARYYLDHRPSADSHLYYYRHRYYSGEFYSRGKAQAIDAAGISALPRDSAGDFLVIRTDDLDRIPPEQRTLFRQQKRFDQFVVLETVSQPHLSQFDKSHAPPRPSGQFATRRTSDHAEKSRCKKNGSRRSRFYFLQRVDQERRRRATPARPTRPVPNSHAAAGTGTSGVVPFVTLLTTN